MLRRVPPAPGQVGSALVEIGTSTGGLVRGRLRRVGAVGLVDALNHSIEPAIALDGATFEGSAQPAVAIVRRQEVLWARTLEPEPEPEPPPRPGTLPRPVLLHVGPFELRGMLHVYPRVVWADFLLALEDQFFPLRSVLVSAPGGVASAPLLAVNAARVAALVAVDAD